LEENITISTTDESSTRKRRSSLKQPHSEQADQLINQPCFGNDETTAPPPKKNQVILKKQKTNWLHCVKIILI
jgi:hypothetical protein